MAPKPGSELPPVLPRAGGRGDTVHVREAGLGVSPVPVATRPVQGVNNTQANRRVRVGLEQHDKVSPDPSLCWWSVRGSICERRDIDEAQ